LKHVAKTGRNEPCPCGSGRKFKLCHGALVITPAALAAAPGARQCGECTACCEGWAEGEIRGHRMFPGQHCHFLQEGACTIYEERPQSPCRNFVCGWLVSGSPFPETWRPDRVGVIIVPMRWRDRPCHVLLSAGQEPSDETVAWMQAHSRATGWPFYYEHKGERLGYGPAAFQQDMLEKLQRGEKLW
jgi:SEC-C motif